MYCFIKKNSQCNVLYKKFKSDNRNIFYYPGKDVLCNLISIINNIAIVFPKKNELYSKDFVFIVNKNNIFFGEK